MGNPRATLVDMKFGHHSQSILWNNFSSRTLDYLTDMLPSCNEANISQLKKRDLDILVQVLHLYQSFMKHFRSYTEFQVLTAVAMETLLAGT
jgi:hypothetical protein